jgi:hypothetical protein
MGIKALNDLPDHIIDHAALGIRKNAYIPEYAADPATAKKGDVWAVDTGYFLADAGGQFQMLGFPMMMGTIIAQAGTVQVSYKDNYGTLRLLNSLNQNVTVQTVNYTAATAVDMVVCDSAVAMTVTLPVASGSGKGFNIKNVNSGAAVIVPNGSDTIDGASSQTVNQWNNMYIIDYQSNKWAIT